MFQSISGTYFLRVTVLHVLTSILSVVFLFSFRNYAAINSESCVVILARLAASWRRHGQPGRGTAINPPLAKLSLDRNLLGHRAISVMGAVIRVCYFVYLPVILLTRAHQSRSAILSQIRLTGDFLIGGSIPPTAASICMRQPPG